MTDKWFSICIVLISSFFLVYGQDSTKAAEHTSQINTLFLKTTWDGNLLSNKTEFVPVKFSALPSADSKLIIVAFNSTSLTIDQEKFLTPDVFGILFKGENDTILQVEVTKGGSSTVALFNGFAKPLELKQKLGVNYQERVVQTSSTWNGTINIPVEYFARGTKQLSAYANFSQAPDHATIVLTLLSSKEQQQKSVLPNLLRQEFFIDHVINADFTKWSPIWQNLIDVSPGGTMVNQTEKSKPDAIKQDGKIPSNESSIIEQGLVTWILVSAIFCGMLHIFVLAL